MPFYDYKCACGLDEPDVYRKISERDNYMECPLCGGQMLRYLGQTRRSVTTDEIPGGVWIENLGRRPIKVYSHTERLAIAKERGLQEFVRHQPLQGTDKSPYTTNWSSGSIDPYTLAAATALVQYREKVKPEYGDFRDSEILVEPFNKTQTELRPLMSAIREATRNE